MSPSSKDQCKKGKLRLGYQYYAYLSNSGKHLIPIQKLGNDIGHVHTVKTRYGQEGSINHAIVQFPQPALYISTEVHDFQGGVLGKDLGLSAERGTTNHGARREALNGLGLRADEGITGVLTGKVAWKDGSFREPCWHILHGVDADVDFLALYFTCSTI